MTIRPRCRQGAPRSHVRFWSVLVALALSGTAGCASPSTAPVVTQKKTVKLSVGSFQLFMVKGCVKADREPMMMGAVDWSASGPGGENYGFTSVSGDSRFEPSFPIQRTVDPGKCLQGWVMFKTKGQIVELVYTNTGMPFEPGAFWKIQ